ncbi:MATE family efflux transporter [Oleidesulfovibrio sp.]|uniref:MATE family efflux transporter n=1 Tax=Oleidesulfovibrio sp. TaxID=2909707 RepID=UPI003A83AEA5
MPSTETPPNSSTHPFITNPARTFLSMAVPVLFSLVAEPLTGLADTAFVARLGEAPLAALGVGTMTLSAIFWAFNFLSIGAQTEVAQAVGANNRKQASNICGTALLLSLFLGVVTAAIALPFLPAAVTFMGADKELAPIAAEYIRIRLIGAPALLITLAGIGALRGLQDMRTPFWVACIVNLLNILLDWVLIFGIGPFPELGVTGAALATSLSQWAGALWTLLVVWRALKPSWNIRLHDIKRLFSIGSDLFVRSGMVIVFLLLGTRAATEAGTDAGAAHQAIRQFFIFSALFLDTFAITGQSLIGLFYGRRNITQSRKIAAFVCRWSLWAGVAMTAAMLLGQDIIGWLLVPQQTMATFTSAWIIAALIQPLNALSFATDGIHWGTGDFKFIRNAMVTASVISVASLLTVQYVQPDSLLCWVWGITGLWTSIRAYFGIVRIWPGSASAPLGRANALASG